jgi:hypothetical protein
MAVPGKDAQGALEYWSIGIEHNGLSGFLVFSFTLLHHSITP